MCRASADGRVGHGGVVVWLHLNADDRVRTGDGDQHAAARLSTLVSIDGQHRQRADDECCQICRIEIMTRRLRVVCTVSPLLAAGLGEGEETER